MTKQKLLVQLLYEDAILPERSNPTDSGLDVYAHNTKIKYNRNTCTLNGQTKYLEEKIKYRSYVENIQQNFSELPLTLNPNERALIGTGISCTVGKGYEIQVRPRSGLALKHGISIVNTPGTIDESYTGEIGVILINHSNTPYTINKDDKIAQIVVAPVLLCDVCEVEELEITERGNCGFGSTGS